MDATQTFGVQGSELARSREDSDSRPEGPPKRISASVTAIEKRPRGELVMTERGGDLLTGRMYYGAVALDLVPSQRAEGARLDGREPLGYELRVDDLLVGAVQTMNAGAVWIDRNAPAPLQESAAVAAATLLLYEELAR